MPYMCINYQSVSFVPNLYTTLLHCTSEFPSFHTHSPNATRVLRTFGTWSRTVWRSWTSLRRNPSDSGLCSPLSTILDTLASRRVSNTVHITAISTLLHVPLPLCLTFFGGLNLWFSESFSTCTYIFSCQLNLTNFWLLPWFAKITCTTYVNVLLPYFMHLKLYV